MRWVVEGAESSEREMGFGGCRAGVVVVGAFVGFCGALPGGDGQDEERKLVVVLLESEKKGSRVKR